LMGFLLETGSHLTNMPDCHNHRTLFLCNCHVLLSGSVSWKAVCSD
jgi:hypothetical protein